MYKFIWNKIISPINLVDYLFSNNLKVILKMNVPKFLSVYWLRIKIQKMKYLFEKKNFWGET